MKKGEGGVITIFASLAQLAHAGFATGGLGAGGWPHAAAGSPHPGADGAPHP